MRAFFIETGDMKIPFFSSASASVVGAALLVIGGHATASDGTISFLGSIDASTCTITTAGTSGSFVVLLPKVSTQALKTEGSTGGDTAFEIKLTGCSDVSGNIMTNFEAGTNVDMPSGRLNNSAPSGAKKIQIQLLNATNASAILVGHPIASQNSLGAALTANGDKGVATLRYLARYYATGVSTPGTVTSQVTYTLVFP